MVSLISSLDTPTFNAPWMWRRNRLGLWPSTVMAAMVQRLRVRRSRPGRLYISPYTTWSTRSMTSGASSDMAGGGPEAAPSP